jgi:uncharacterized membrane protein (UPF0127 family)
MTKRFLLIINILFVDDGRAGAAAQNPWQALPVNKYFMVRI